MNDAKRYAILRRYVTPRDLYDSLHFHGLIRTPWSNLPPEQSITEKIDELCDEAIAGAKP